MQAVGGIARDDGSQLTMLIVQHGDVASPSIIGERTRQGEPVAPFEGERAALIAAEPATHRIFPVRGVNDNVGDAAPSRSGAPVCLEGVKPANGAAKIGPMPGFLVVAFVEKVEQESDLGCRSVAGHWSAFRMCRAS